MSRFSKEIRQIPRTGWIIAVVIYATLAILIGIFFGTVRDVQAWPPWSRTLLRATLPIPLSIYALLVSYIYADAQRRAMRHVLWTLLAIFIPNGIGIILYFMLREPRLEPCRVCGAMAKHSFAFCPKCGESLAPACPKCKRGVEADWSVCAYCGEKL